MSKNNNSVKNTEHIQKKNLYKRFLSIYFFFFIISIAIPLILVNLNQTGSCLHHIEEEGGLLWILGRALGFSTLIWFILSVYIGAKTKKLAKLFHSYPKAKNFHCISAFITNILFLAHIISLLISDPWGPLIFEREFNHMPFTLFLIKLITGIIFGSIMIITSIMFYYLKDIKKLRKFGYKKFIRTHQIMLIFTIVLAIHIFFINTEILIIFWG
ncbi:MAG: hypothetical protein JXA99_13475 [Candidatus Lokiarchaeota archaeon]|nr:hypothetical protein [Candidatus Lokiarchaeota archaeon]